MYIFVSEIFTEGQKTYLRNMFSAPPERTREGGSSATPEKEGREERHPAPAHIGRDEGRTIQAVAAFPPPAEGSEVGISPCQAPKSAAFI